jgi:hypothetical protein
MVLFLTLLSGVCWTLVYLDSVRIGLKDKTYAIPLFALALNFAWEVIYSYLGFTSASGPDAQTFVNAVWALVDLGIVYTYFRFGYRYWPKAFSRRIFVAWSILVFALGFVLQVLFEREFGPFLGARYSAFLQNLLMSVLFISFLVQRRGTEGQTMTIAVGKWIGTLAPTILFGWIEASLFILVVGLLCGLFDLIYLGLLVWARQHPLALSSLPSEWDETSAHSGRSPDGPGS